MSDSQKIPFLDLVGLHEELEKDLVTIFQKVLKTASFVGGPMVEEFECEFARFCDAAYCVGVASGTDAVRFALMAAGVKPGDIVVTVPHTFIATTEAISQAGARPEFVDIDERTYCMDPAKLREYVESQCYVCGETGKLFHRKRKAPVTAVVPVHIYGQMADMDPILELANKHDLIVVEDACQAHGAEYFSKKENRWRKAGSMGHAAAFSFYPGKNLGACGEAGAVTTNVEATAREIRMLRDHGQSKKYFHDEEGYNGRLDAIQAGILSVKLRFLPDWNERRRTIAQSYRQLFGGVEGDIQLPEEAPWARHVYHLYVVRVLQRDQLLSHLAASQIGTGIHYPIPLHVQKAYQTLGFKQGAFPITERVSSEILSLPMYPQLQLDQQRQLVRTIVEYLSVAAPVTQCSEV